jgi:hypothetical protein
MPIPIVPLVAPASKSWLGVGRELTLGTAVLPVQTIPLLKNSFQPEDVPKWLHDEAIRGSMALVFNDIQGVESSTFSYGGPAFLDVEGYFIDNVFGDKSDAATTYGTTQVIGVGNSGTIGQTSLALTAATGITVGQYAAVGTGSIQEIVGTLTVAGTVITFLNTPLRFPHVAGENVRAVNGATNGPFTHTWNILNNSSGQPPTHTLTDFTSLTANVGARAYVGACVGVLDITGNSEQLLEMKMTGDAWVSAPAASTPTNVVSTAIPIPNWRSTVTVGGTQVFDVGEWSVAIKRTLQIYWTDQGTVQNPYIIARGPLDATGVLNYTVPTDESPLTQMLTNTQPTLSINVGNGISGAGTLGMTIACNVCAFEKAKPSRSEVLIGYQDDWQAVANSTNAGGSGGLGPLTLTVVNNIPTY